MAWAIAIAFLALMALWIITGFIGEMLDYRRKREASERESHWHRR